MSFRHSLAFLVEGESQFLERYGFSIPAELNRESNKMLKNEDLNHTILNLLLLEKKGDSFCSKDIGETRAYHLPPNSTS